MMKQDFIFLVGVLILILVLIAPVTAGPATQIEVSAGNSQSATAGTAVAAPPSIIVKDASNHPVKGVMVTFAVTSGGGSITSPTTITALDGIATVGSWTLGTTAGTNTLSATNGSLTVTFTATGTAGAATQMVANSVTSQSATAYTTVPTPPSVVVKDAHDNPVHDQPVAFTISVGGGYVSPSTVMTNTDGIATVSSWTIGTIGTNSLIATSGLLTPITFTATGTSSTSHPSIISISPTSAVNSGQQTIDITGTGFNGSTVTLTKTGQSTINGVTIGTDTTTTLSRTFVLSGIAPGTWNLVILNSDEGSVTGSFTVNNATAATVTSISPTSGTANNTVSTTIIGSGFTPDSAKIRLYKSSNYIGGAVNSGGSTTQLTGSFNLNYASPGTYDVCVLYDGTEASKTCGPTFTIYSEITGANGSINVKSAPSGGRVFLKNEYKGYTPITLENITPGIYTVTVLRTGYSDYSESVKVTAANISYITAYLELLPETTMVVTTTAKPVITTVTTIKKSTLKVPTTWPSATAAEGSPVDPVVMVGAVGICLGLVVIRRR